MSRRRYLISLLLWLALMLFAARDGVSTLHWVDDAFYRAAAGQRDVPVRLLFPGESPRTAKVLTPQYQQKYPSVLYTLWDADAVEPEPKLQELATIIHCLVSNHAIPQVVLSTPLTWADVKNNTVHLMLSNALSNVRVLYVGLHGNNAAQAQPTPKLIRENAIPSSCLMGDPDGLPAANAAYPRQLPESKVSLPCPDFTEDELLSAEEAQSRGLSLPLLMRWNENVYATLPLCVAMKHLGLKPMDLRVHFGNTLRLGKRSVPLDKHGRTPLSGAQAVYVPLREVLQPTHIEESSIVHSPVAVICRPMHEMVGEDRGKCLAATISCLLAKEHTTYLPETRREHATFLTLSPVQCTWAGLAIVWAVGLAALLILRIVSLRTRFLLAIFGIVGIYLFAWYVCRKDQWISISTWQLCWLLIVACPIAHRRNRKESTDTLPQENMSQD